MKKDRLSYSALTRFDKSPNHLLAYWESKFVQTSAMQEGSLGHLLILEPEKFKDKYRIYEGRRAGKVWEQFKLDTEAENPKLEIITKATYNNVETLIEKVQKDPQLIDILSQVGETEKYIQWERKGLNFHGFIDGVADDFIMDIKFCQESGEKFQRDLKWGTMNMQGAMYLDYYDFNKDYFIVAIEKKTPYNVQVYKLGWEFLQKGKIKYFDLIDKYNEWDGKPQGYKNGIIEI